MGGGTPKPPPPPPDVEQTIDDAGKQASEAERRRLADVTGFRSTFLTSPAGVLTPAHIGKETLG
ncbi:MAG: hypothetical protein EXR86_12400 [Gammaproteobacteria bacterium]|nr:hypothetical protein [Gammaproteobacteria bacterium]